MVRARFIRIRKGSVGDGARKKILEIQKILKIKKKRIIIKELTRLATFCLIGCESVKPTNKNKFLKNSWKKEIIITVEETNNDTSDQFLHLDKTSPSWVRDEGDTRLSQIVRRHKDMPDSRASINLIAFKQF